MSDFDKTLEVIAQIDRCQTFSSLMHALTNFTSKFGLDCLIAGTMPGGRETKASLKDRFLLSGFDPGWLERYINNRYVEVDPVIERIKRSSVPFLWSEIQNSSHAPVGTVGRRVLNEATEFRLREGFAVPLWTTDFVAAVSLAGEHAELSPSERGMVALASTYAVTKAMTLNNIRSERQRASLSPRELECLKWVAAGKTEWEIGMILNISEHTADRHLANVHRKLGAVTRPQAIANAFRLGFIT
ncbi:LuxR family transcriptional regulator [Martelella alba]|uniref:LuxR family transcriptional regulator n=1 Tax=Martelella alba TaxID=2590451 RepID=A0A506TWH0_9HYPH|nr:LuxR family transcriptional regulator [Martelella alba]TPW26422.1 LuxR family transcriptional regulator [Martelella alba]